MNNYLDQHSLNSTASNTPTDVLLIGDLPSTEAEQTQGNYIDANFDKRKLRRVRKSENQINELTKYFRENPNWDKEQVTFLSQKLKLSESQIYK